MSVRVTSNVLDELAQQAGRAHPRECCGILLGKGNHITAIQPAANIHPASETHFEIDPQVLLDAHRAERAGGPEVAGYYHSHPASPARPSATDAEMASGDGRIWAIIGQNSDILFWRDGESGFEALSYQPSRG